MELQEIAMRVDHTNLKQTAVWSDIEKLCKEAIKYKAASVCIPPCFVKKVKEVFGEQVKICTVIGFPNGYSTTSTKVFETSDAIKNGADEIDMVININLLKDKDYKGLEEEITQIKEACEGKTIKVIIETCLLENDEKIRMCEIITKSGADYIKTSTGFSTAGAKLEDIILFKSHIGEKVKIKAAGGIKDIEDAKKFINAGADRIGASRVIKHLEQE